MRGVWLWMDVKFWIIKAFFLWKYLDGIGKVSTFAPAFRNGAAAPPHEVRPEWLRWSGGPAWAHLSMRITQRLAEWFKVLQNFSRKNLVVWKRGCNFATLFRRRNPEAKRSEHWKIYNSDEVVQERTADFRVCENLLCQYPRHNTLRQKPGQEINHSGFVRSLRGAAGR